MPATWSYRGISVEIEPVLICEGRQLWVPEAGTISLATLVDGYDQRLPEPPQWAPSDARSNLLSRLRKLWDEVLDPPDLGEKASPQPFGSEFEVGDLQAIIAIRLPTPRS